MLMTNKTIHFEIMKNDTPGVLMMNLTKTLPRCDSDDCSIRVLYL